MTTCFRTRLVPFLDRNSALYLSCRTYFKFKRVYSPPLPTRKESPYIVGPYLKPDYLTPRWIIDPIREHHDDHLNYFIYKPEEVKSDKKRTVKLLLTQDVEGYGIAGSVVDVPFRLGSTRLVALGKAEYATDFAFKWYKFGPRTFKSASSALSPRTVRLLGSQIYDLPLRPDTPIEPWHLSLALRLSGFICPVEAIESNSIKEYLSEGSDMPQIECIIKINNHEEVVVRFAFKKDD